MLINIQFFSIAGRMHPLLVHLPIGILITGLMLQWFSRNGKNASLRPALLPIYLAGCIAAMLSCISGYILSLNEDYDTSLLQTHQWMGISVAIVSIMLFLGFRGLRWFTPYKNGIAFLLFGGIIYTSHLGGTLTHGSNFLIQSNTADKTSTSFTPLKDAQKAVVFTDIIQPILQVKCYSCHGPQKQKGKLRLDSKEAILKGGKDGKVITAVNKGVPELLKRILLPPDDDDHMPPKEKGQLSEMQKDLIKWWLNEGADFTAQSYQLHQSDTIKKALVFLETAPAERGIVSEQRESVDVVEASKTIVDSLRNSGVLVLQLSKKSNALSVSMLNVTRLSDTIWFQLTRCREQIFLLDASGPLTTSSALISISGMINLRKLNLANTSINDEALKQLGGLQELFSLNLTGTKITEEGLISLKKMKKLKWLYVSGSAVNLKTFHNWKLQLPNVSIDTGGYTLPVMISDTQFVKPKKS